MMKKVVTIGGGGGHAAVVKALKGLPIELTILCNTADDGGGSGRLIREYGVHVPGDLRQMLCALGGDKAVFLAHRFTKGKMQGQTVGNLLLSSLELSWGSQEKAIEMLREWLKIKETIIPITSENITVHVQTKKKKVVGQANMVKHLWVHPKDTLEHYAISPESIRLSSGAKEALLHADVIVCAMGDLYSSIAPCLAIKEMNTVLKKTKAKIVWLPNSVSAPGQIHYISITSALKFLQSLCPSFQPDTILFPEIHFSPKTKKILLQKGYNVTLNDVVSDKKTKIILSDLIDSNRAKKFSDTNGVERSPVKYRLLLLTKVLKSIL